MSTRWSCVLATTACDSNALAGRRTRPGGSGLGGMLLRVLLPVAVLLGFGLLVLRRSTGGGGRFGSFGRAPARQPAADGPMTSPRLAARVAAELGRALGR